jgi:hypothetical protein
MTEKQRQGVKQTAQELYRARRITLKTAIWAIMSEAWEENSRPSRSNIRVFKESYQWRLCNDKN